MTKKTCNFDNESLSISESYFDLKREPEKNQILGDAIEYLSKFIDWCFFVPSKSYNWTKQSRYCYKIKSNHKKDNIYKNIF